MANVYVSGKRQALSAKTLVGKGGEADVYLLNPTTVLKRYKEPDDPDYTGNIGAQTGAAQRLQEQQRKLPAFPKGLPAQVVRPLELAYDKPTGGQIVGYTMQYLDNMEVLLRYGDRQYREQGGIDGNSIVTIFRNFHQLLSQIHDQQVVVGDCNDLNVLVDQTGQVHLVDADSMQFGRFTCHTYTTRFVDPLLCEPNKLVLAAAHNQQSDWYAYMVMLFQSLLYVEPYGGVHRTKNGPRLQREQRELRRLTVFDSDVIYPKPALPLSVLPDDLLGHFQAVFEQDVRGVFPLDLLSGMRWTTCTKCGSLHARVRCPVCAAPGAVKETVVIRGTVTATRVFRTDGRILHATYQGNKLCYLYHRGDEFCREDGMVVLTGALDPELRFRIQDSQTLLGKRERLFVMTPGEPPQRITTDTFRQLPMFDANQQHRYWIENGQLVRDGRFGSQFIGDVLSGQTLFWTGQRFGFGFYQAGQLVRSFVFDAENQGLNDRVAIPSLPGQILDATCVFGAERAWFMVSAQQNGQLVNRCYVISRQGQILAATTATAGDDVWLAHGIRGHLAMGESLYVATDEGVLRLATDNGQVIVERTFPDTEPFVSAGTQLIPAPNGMYAVSTREIVFLQIR